MIRENEDGSFPTFAAREPQEEELDSPGFSKSGLERKHNKLLQSIEEIKGVQQPENSEISLSPVSINADIEVSPLVGTSPKRELDLTEIQISYEDILTDKETKDFWQKYFRHDSTVEADFFCSCLAEDEDFSNIFPQSFPEREELIKAIKERVSLDGNNVSLNALQVFTRVTGLQNALRELAAEIPQGAAESESYEEEHPEEQNEIILAEIEEVKKILEEKHKALIKKEHALREKEITLENQERNMLSRVADFANAQVKQIELQITKGFKVHAKQLEAHEQQVSNKILILKRRLQEAKEIPEASSKIRKKSIHSTESKTENTGERLKKQQQRILSLEQYKKELKIKADSLSNELIQEKAKNEELLKQFEKSKQYTRIIEQKLNRAEEVPAPPPVMKPIINKEEIKKEENQPIKPKEAVDLISSREIIPKYSKLIAELVQTFKQSEREDQLGELLYPHCSEILLSIIECLRVSASAPCKSNLYPLIDLSWDLINCAFENHALPLMMKQKTKKATLLKPIIIESSAKKSFKSQLPESPNLPLFTIFSNPVQAAQFLKDIDNIMEIKKPTAAQKKLLSNSLCSSYLIHLLLSDTKKKAKASSEKLRKLFDADDEILHKFCEKRCISSLALASTISEVSADCCSIFLALSIDPACKAELYSQLINTESLSFLLTAFENSISEKNKGMQDDLVVLLHKLVLANSKQLDMSLLQQLKSQLRSLAATESKDERPFFINNVSSLLKFISEIQSYF